jgi:hypothetical protein
LYHYLAQHPQIAMSLVKEPCYFAPEMRLGNFDAETRPRMERVNAQLEEYLRGPMNAPHFGGVVERWEDYLKLFRHASAEAAVGESSVCYLWSKTAAANIRSAIPGARILMILRDPAERAFSQYLHLVTMGFTRKSFAEVIDEGLRASREQFGMFHPFLDFGMYAEQVQRFRENFPPEQIRIYFYEEYRTHAHELLQDIFEFLKIDPNFKPDVSRRYLEAGVPRMARMGYLLKKYGAWDQLKKLVPAAARNRAKSAVLRKRSELRNEPKDRARLIEYYRDDIRTLGTLLDKDLSHWLD